MLEAKFRNSLEIHYTSFVSLNRFKVSFLHEETSENQNINIVGCYATWLKVGICTVTNMDVEILMHMEIYLFI